MRTDVVDDPELLELMRDSGCDRVALGLESVSQETLDGFDKSQSVDDIVRALDTLHKYGIKTHGMFVLGADSDTAETIRETARFARKHDISTLMLNILTPLPGTPLFDELDAKGRIFDRHWDLFDGQHVVFTPRKMTPQTAADRGLGRLRPLLLVPPVAQVPGHVPLRDHGAVQLVLGVPAPLAQGEGQPRLPRDAEAAAPHRPGARPTARRSPRRTGRERAAARGARRQASGVTNSP